MNILKVYFLISRVTLNRLVLTSSEFFRAVGLIDNIDLEQRKPVNPEALINAFSLCLPTYIVVI